MPGEAGLPSYLAVLNPEQLAAVRHDGASLLILAGAGSGKTRVITTKIAYLIKEKAVSPESILAVTFTNKAAREMALRAQGLEARAAGTILRTFHSFGAWMLRRNGTLLGLDSRFVIYDDDDSGALVSAVAPELTRVQAAQTAARIARAKDYGLSPKSPELDAFDPRPEFQSLYAAYEERLNAIGNVDFGDLIMKPVTLLRAFPEVRQRLRQRFRIILVDEYQDSNVAQFQLLRELAGNDTYICVVGDDDQSIYRFRGAEVRNILEFPKHFPKTDTIRLERNYRSVEPILAVASAVVDHNRERFGKELRAQRGGGKKPVLAFLDTQDQEAAFCAELVERSRPAARYADWAILYRTNAQSLGFETEFLRRRIPYHVVGSLKFYDREEVKDALAFLSLTVNGRDEIAFKRVVNKPSRGIGPAAIVKLMNEAFSGKPYGDLVAAAERLGPKLGKKAAAGAAVFTETIAMARRYLEDGEPNSAPAKSEAAKAIGGKRKSGVPKEQSVRGSEGLSRFLARLLEASGLVEYHRGQDEIAGTQKIGNLQELVNASGKYEASLDGLCEFLEHIELDRSLESQANSDDAVTLITIHNTKGLEFRRVVISGMEQGIFPRDEKRGDDLEEERRLFYVGATRAMDELYFTACGWRRQFGRVSAMQPSVFLSEIPREAVRTIGASPLESRQGAAFDDTWAPGTRLFNDDNGYGVVVSQKRGDEGLLVTVRFENGQETRFLPKYQAGQFLRIKGDV